MLYPVYHWYEAHKTYFSTEGERGLIYLKRTNYTHQLPGIETLVTRLQAETGLIKHIDAWPVKFKVTIPVLYTHVCDILTVQVSTELRETLCKILKRIGTVYGITVSASTDSTNCEKN